MKITLLSICLLLGWLTGPTGAAELREWTTARGAKTKAEFVELKGDRLILKTADGQRVEILISQLSPADQVVARKLAQPKLPTLPGRSEPQAVEHVPVLPQFTEGPWAGWHAVYEHPQLDVLIATNGFVTVYPKENGRRIGPAFGCNWHMYYYPDPREPRRHRTVQYFDEYAPPSVNPKQVRFAGVADGNTKFELEFTFASNTWTASYALEIPPRKQYDMFRFQIYLPTTHRFADTTPREKIIQELAGYQFQFVDPKGHETQYQFHQHVSLTKSLVSAEIKGPWGPRVLTIEQRKTAPLYATNYRSTALYRGFAIIQDVKPATKNPPIRFTLK